MARQYIHRGYDNPAKSGARASLSRFGLLPVIGLLLLLAGSLAKSQTVSVNFVGGYSGNQPANMDPTEVAGVVPVANWNQAVGQSGSLTGLVDSTNAATPFSVTWTSPNTWATGVADAPGNARMLKGYLDSGGVGSAPANTSFTVAGLDANATYSVYVYSVGAETGDSGIYTIGSQTFYLLNNGISDGSNFTQATSTNAAAPTLGNYLVFTVTGQTTFTATATPDGAGGGGFRSPLNSFQIFKVVQPPAAPTGLTATAFDSGATLNWNASAGASSYNVLRGSKTGGPYTSLATGVLSSSYTDTGLTNGTTYYYVVQAVNKNGTSANSNEASVTPVPAVIGSGTISVNFVGGGGTTVPSPMAPTEVAGVSPVANWNNLTGTGGSVTALLDSAGGTTSAAVTVSGVPNTWSSAVPDNPGNQRLMVGYLDTNNTSTTSVTLSGLSPTKTYLIYAYAARDGGGSAGIYSVGAQSFAMTTDIFNGTFTQSTATDPAKPTFGNYVVFQVTGQAAYTVTATPDITTGGFRAPLNGVQAIVLTAPAAPTNLAGVGLDGSVYLSWTGVAVASSYNLLRSAKAGGPYTIVATGVTGTSYTDTGLTNGKTYYYVLQAVNSIGTSGNSNEASATPVAAVTGNGNGLYGVYYTPGTMDFSAETNGTVVFSNVAPVINFNQGNANVSYNPLPWASGVPSTQFTAVWSGQFLAPYTGSYVFQTITDDGSRVTVDSDTATGTVLFDDETGHGPQADTGAAVPLTAGKKYNIKFEYTQQGGGRTAQLLYSPLGTTFQIIPQSQLFTVFTQGPDTPLNLIAVGHNKSVQLYWNGGLNTASFNVKRSLTAGGPYTTVATGVTSPNYLDTGLTNGVTYYYVVSATNNIGTSANSNEASALTTGATSVVAYWRFEEGAAGAVVAPLAQIPDATGHNNTLQTPDAGAAPTYAASVFGNPTTPAANNALSLDFSAAPVAPDVARYLDTTGATGDINSHAFNQFTVEASFNTTTVGSTQTLVGKDGGLFLGDTNPANAALYFQINTGVLSIRGHQGDQTFVVCDGVTPILVNHWYNGAAVSDGHYLSLYLQSDPGGPYHLENVTPFVGMLFDGENQPFSVGRGFYNNAIADSFKGKLDEVRISDLALDPSLFLFAAAPGVTVSGSISLEGVANLAGISPFAPLGTFHVSLRTPGTLTEVKGFDVTLATTAGSPVGKYTLSGVTAGTYDVWIKGKKNLAVLVPNVAFAGTSGTVANVLLPAADANGDNFADTSDFGLLVGAYGTDGSIPGSGYDASVDFNFDGFVDTTDFGLLVGNYGAAGAP